MTSGGQNSGSFWKSRLQFYNHAGFLAALLVIACGNPPQVGEKEATPMGGDPDQPEPTPMHGSGGSAEQESNGGSGGATMYVGGAPGLVDSMGYVPLFPADTEVLEEIQVTEPDGTLVTYMGARPTERHARERGEAWDAPDEGPGRYLTFVPFYFQNRTFGLEIRDTIPAGGDTIELWLHVNQGSFRGTTMSLFRNVQNQDVRDFGWSLNYGFNNPNEGGEPLCHADKLECMMDFDSNWRTDPHSPLQVGDKIELAPAPRLVTPVVDGGGERYYSFEQLYVVGVGMRPWYGISPNLDSEPVPSDALLGGEASVSYNYSEEPHLMFHQMVNNIGIKNAQRFAEGRRLFHTSFETGKHSEHSEQNPIFAEHVDQLGERHNATSCISCHKHNARSVALQVGGYLAHHSILTNDENGGPDQTYGLNIQQYASSADAPDFAVRLVRYETEVRRFADGEEVELRTPVYAFSGPLPEAYSVRQAPQVIGMGLLEAILEETILSGVDDGDEDEDGVIGTPSWVKNPETGETHLGRFGWKAGKASVRHQASEALLLDIGITTPIFPKKTCQKTLLDDCRGEMDETDVSALELERLVQYLQLVGVPAQRNRRSGYPEGIRVSPEHDVDPQEIEAGSALFEAIGCTSCHRRTMVTGSTHPLAEMRDQTIHPYSDLLLHDMGEGLADSLTQGNALPRMWRTPPLWGLGTLKYAQGDDGLPGEVRYLHDGRAHSLDEAILWHGGEAEKSRGKYEELPRSDRAALRAFLDSL